MHKKNRAEDAQSGDKHKTLHLKINAGELALRILYLVVGLFIMSLGVALSIRADLGTSPISSIPYALNIITNMDVGTTTIIVNTLIVLLQIVLLRKRFKWLQIIQVLVAVAFGEFNNLSLAIFSGLTVQYYWEQWLLCVAGIVLVAVGVSCEVAANIMTLPGEGLVLALCKLMPKAKFGYMKVTVDCSLVVIAIILSVIFEQHHNAWCAVREGTVAAAICVGLISKLLNKVNVPLANKLFALTARHGKKQEEIQEEPHEEPHED